MKSQPIKDSRSDFAFAKWAKLETFFRSRVLSVRLSVMNTLTISIGIFSNYLDYYRLYYKDCWNFVSEPHQSQFCLKRFVRTGLVYSMYLLQIIISPLLIKASSQCCKTLPKSNQFSIEIAKNNPRYHYPRTHIKPKANAVRFSVHFPDPDYKLISANQTPTALHNSLCNSKHDIIGRTILDDSRKTYLTGVGPFH